MEHFVHDSKNKKLSELWFYLEIDLQMLNAWEKKKFCKWLLSTCITNLLMKPNFMKQKQNFITFSFYVSANCLLISFKDDFLCCWGSYRKNISLYSAINFSLSYELTVGTFPITLSVDDWQTHGPIWHHVHEVGLLFKISMRGGVTRLAL